MLNSVFDRVIRDISRNMITHALDSLRSVPSVAEPTFTFSHLIMPHPPYVFGPDGMAISKAKERFQGFGKWGDLYLGQLKYANKAILSLVDHILRNSKSPPVIIIQGDHGWLFSGEIGTDEGIRQSMSILNAYYLPAGGDSRLYDAITPVNTFRLVLNHYFDAGLSLLEDTNYYSFADTPFEFRDVTEILSSRHAGARQSTKSTREIGRAIP